MGMRMWLGIMKYDNITWNSKILTWKFCVLYSFVLVWFWLCINRLFVESKCGSRYKVINTNHLENSHYFWRVMENEGFCYSSYTEGILHVTMFIQWKCGQRKRTWVTTDANYWRPGHHCLLPGPWLMTDTVSVCQLEISLLQPSRVLTPAPFLPAFPHLALPPAETLNHSCSKFMEIHFSEQQLESLLYDNPTCPSLAESPHLPLGCETNEVAGMESSSAHSDWKALPWRWRPQWLKPGFSTTRHLGCLYQGKEFGHGKKF